MFQRWKSVRSADYVSKTCLMLSSRYQKHPWIGLECHRTTTAGASASPRLQLTISWGATSHQSCLNYPFVPSCSFSFWWVFCHQIFWAHTSLIYINLSSKRTEALEWFPWENIHKGSHKHPLIFKMCLRIE